MKITLVEIMLYATGQQIRDFQIQVAFIFKDEAKEFLASVNESGLKGTVEGIQAFQMIHKYRANPSWKHLEGTVYSIEKTVERATVEEPERFE